MRRRKNHIGLALVVLIAVILGIGFYRNWFEISAPRAPDTSKVNVNLSIDTDKMQQDTRHAAEVTKEKAAEIGTKVKQEATDLKDRASSKPDRTDSDQTSK